MTTNETSETIEHQPTPQENLQKLLTHYGVAYTGNVDVDIANLAKATPRFAEEYSRTQDIGLTLDALSHTTQKNTTINGWYIASGVINWDAVAKEITRKPGIRVLASNGSTYDVPDFVAPKEWTPIRTKVTVGPCTVRHNILTGETTVSMSRNDRNVVASDHTDTLPNVGVGRSIKKALTPTGRSKVAPGDSGDFPVFATLRIGTGQNDVSYFPDGKFGGETLKVRAYDHEGSVVSIKLDASDVRRTFGIGDGAEREEYKTVLAGEPIACMGKIGATNPSEPARLGGTPEEGSKNFEEFLGWAETQGLLRHYKNRAGQDLASLTFEKAPEGTSSITVGGKRIVTLRQESKDGDVKWNIGVHYEDAGGVPWMSCRRTEYTYRNGDRKGEQGVSNPDGMLVWLNRQPGAKPTSRNFSGLATTLRGFTGENGATPKASTPPSTSVKTPTRWS